jgi:putative redox protein
MAVTVLRDLTGKMRHTVMIRNHTFPTDVKITEGGEDSGPDPHDLYDASIAACKALTVLWYAKRKNIDVQGIEVNVNSDNSKEREGTYKIAASLTLTGDLTQAQKRELLSVAEKCPIHKLMTQVKTEITTELVEP